MQKKTDIEGLLKELFKRYPAPVIALKFTNALELLVATILSAQATDKKVNEVTERLFHKYKTPKDYATADLHILEQDIKEINFYRNKAKMLQQCCRQIISTFNGNVPQTMEELITLSGIGRKTANVILGNAFGKAAIAVDTHVLRVTNRLGIVSSDNPEEVERELMGFIPNQHWTRLSLALILQGREICKARKPLCTQCSLINYCDYYKRQINEKP